MRIPALFLPGAVVAAAAVLLAPPESRGFSVLGGTLDLTQRDVRLFNNFADATANANSVEQCNFGGYTMAELAIWKAIVEWGSLPHGDGSGDPTQPILGSGGANFDAVWQGNAPGIGGTNDNVASAISSCGGPLAFAETPISDGWRIRFCDEFPWSDGPGDPVPGFDIQGVMVHEYGHALGLGHSTDNNATMWPSTTSADTSSRSIDSDDIAGVQFLYGVASPTKPRIDAITLAAGTLVLAGANFDPTSNQVWFTATGGSASGDPVIAAGVGSTLGGTRIELALPAGAGPGDVLVRVPGSSHDRLSNAFPLDPCGAMGVTYCQGKQNSLGCTPSIATTGSPSASLSTAFLIEAVDVVPGEAGLLTYGFQGRANLGFHGGTLCVKAPLVRTAAKATKAGTGACPARLRFDFNQRIRSGLDPSLTLGQQINAQWRTRDPALMDGFGDGLTNGIEFVIGP